MSTFVGGSEKGNVTKFTSTSFSALSKVSDSSGKELTARQSEIFQLVEEFLKNRLFSQKCDRCGSPMQFLDDQFWLHKTVLKWDLRLPFSPNCDIDMMVCLHRITGLEAKAKTAGRQE